MFSLFMINCFTDTYLLDAYLLDEFCHFVKMLFSLPSNSCKLNFTYILIEILSNILHLLVIYCNAFIYYCIVYQETYNDFANVNFWH